MQTQWSKQSKCRYCGHPQVVILVGADANEGCRMEDWIAWYIQPLIHFEEATGDCQDG
jgi:hypothetical protein